MRELQSVAQVLAVLSQVLPPSREARRHFPALVKWFVTYWNKISPWLPYVQLRDAWGEVIDGYREGLDKQCPSW
jgi:hypothetical protein